MSMCSRDASTRVRRVRGGVLSDKVNASCRGGAAGGDPDVFAALAEACSASLRTVFSGKVKALGGRDVGGELAANGMLPSGWGPSPCVAIWWCASACARTNVAIRKLAMRRVTSSWPVGSPPRIARSMLSERKSARSFSTRTSKRTRGCVCRKSAIARLSGTVGKSSGIDSRMVPDSADALAVPIWSA